MCCIYKKKKNKNKNKKQTKQNKKKKKKNKKKKKKKKKKNKKQLLWASALQNLQLDLCDKQRLGTACTFTHYGKGYSHPSLDSLETVEGTCD